MGDGLARAKRLYAPPGLARKRRDLRFSAVLGDEAPAERRDDIDQVCVRGSFARTEVLFFHRRPSTCLIGDLIQRHDVRSAGAWRRWLAKAVSVDGPDGGTPRNWRHTLLRRGLAQEAVQRALA